MFDRPPLLEEPFAQTLSGERRGKNEDELVESESGVRSVEKQLGL